MGSKSKRRDEVCEERRAARKEENVGEDNLHSRLNWKPKASILLPKTFEILVDWPLSEGVWQLSLANSEIGVVGETWDALRCP